ncbi:MAG: trypsin-like peptidase domain-containing protein [Planctomycetes bacterium]|nr:trypsin-like peptidase domain-containing protein [Planctomycetota bacterium]
MQQMAFCTTRILVETESEAVGVGTGFFFAFTIPNDEKFIATVITNRHVVKDATRLLFQITRADADQRPMVGNVTTVIVEDVAGTCVNHPDPEVDLCALPIGHVIAQAEAQGRKLFIQYLAKSLIPSPDQNLTVLQEVVMVGYPTGLYDTVNHLPIFRKGIAATAPLVDYCGRKEFMIDAAVFQGSSGSPVFLWGPGIIEDPNTILSGGVRVALIGILRALPVSEVKGKIKIIPVPTGLEAVPVTQMPINLGLVIQAKRLLEFEPIFDEMLKRPTPSP